MKCQTTPTQELVKYVCEAPDIVHNFNILAENEWPERKGFSKSSKRKTYHVRLLDSLWPARQEKAKIQGKSIPELAAFVEINLKEWL